MSSELRISVDADPAKEVTRALFDGLFHANVERTGDGKIDQLCVVARDCDGVLVGGIYGEIYWGWLNILVLWVTPNLRRQGLGARLLSRAEIEAVAREVFAVHLPIVVSLQNSHQAAAS